MDFNLFWNTAYIAPKFCNRYYATRDVWDKRSAAAQTAILDNIDKMGDKNPYFFVLDFPEPQPEFLRGDELNAEVQVKYNGMFKICSRATMELYGLEYVRDWN